MLAHQVGGSLETCFARHEFTLGSEKIYQTFSGEMFGRTSAKA